MFKWIERRANEKHANAIRSTLAMLIEASNEASSTIDRLGASTTRQRETIHGLEAVLIDDLDGPLPMDEIKQRILEPAIRSPDTSQEARLPIEYAYD
ncbi:MAG TPA: hypothetical protein VF277_10035, partial [Steroidobacteraceae bacterium]